MNKNSASKQINTTMAQSDNALGEQLRLMRVERNLSQSTVADALNIDRSSYSNYESGKTVPPVYMLKCLSEYFGISIEKLIYLIIESPTDKPFDIQIFEANELAKFEIEFQNRAALAALNYDEKLLLYYYKTLLSEDERTDLIASFRRRAIRNATRKKDK